MPTSGYFFAKDPHYVSQQNIMFILYRSDLPYNPNIYIFNQRKVRRPYDVMVISSRDIPLVGYMYEYTPKIMGAY